MIFSQNQNRHVFVAKAYKTKAEGAANQLSNAGDIHVGGPTNNEYMYFEYITPAGQIRSDIIKFDNILWAQATPASAMAMPLKTAKVVLDSTLNSGAPIAGEDYILNLTIKQFVGGSEEDTYHKQGVVHAYTGMTASTFYLKLAKSLALNFSRDINKFFKFYVTESGQSDIEITKSTNIDNVTPTSAFDGVLIKEIQQDNWALGTIPLKSVNFKVNSSFVYDSNGDERIWGVITYGTNGSVVNSHLIADLEWDAMVERADVYKNVGWPYVINTTYLVDPSNSYGYDCIDIHFYFVDSKEGAQKSEKTITLVCNRTGASDHTVANAIAGAINAKKSSLINTLS